MLTRERQVQLQAQILRMAKKKEEHFLKLDDLSTRKLLMFYVALCKDSNIEKRRLDYIESKIQNLSEEDNNFFIHLLLQVASQPQI